MLLWRYKNKNQTRVKQKVFPLFRFQFFEKRVLKKTTYLGEQREKDSF
jgi:hypothetical protein